MNAPTPIRGRPAPLLRIALPLALALALPACGGDPSAPPAATQTPDVAAPDRTPAAQPATPAPAPIASATLEPAEAPAFAGKTWKVVESAAVQAGTTYDFEPDGTLFIENPAGDPPGQGTWRYADGKLKIQEEGVSYPTDILRLDDGHFDIRSHNPGGALDIRMVPADP